MQGITALVYRICFPDIISCVAAAYALKQAGKRVRTFVEHPYVLDVEREGTPIELPADIKQHVRRANYWELQTIIGQSDWRWDEPLSS